MANTVDPDQTSPKRNLARVDKNIFMLNSAEHEVLNALKYKNIRKFSFLAHPSMLRVSFLDCMMSVIRRTCGRPRRL